MNEIEIRNVTRETIDDLIDLCVPLEKRNDPRFVKGHELKKKWAIKMLERYGEFAKIAFFKNKLARMIQYAPDIEREIIKIACIFVPYREYQQKGVAKALVLSLIEDMKKPKSWFNNKPPLALVTYAFEVPGWFPQHKFFQKMGFKKVEKDNPYLLYYPLKEDYTYKEDSREYIPQPEDKNKVLIFYSPDCPFSIYFNEKIKESIKEVAPNLTIQEINMFEEPDEVKKRGKVPFCVVNQQPISSFFMDKENFQKEVLQALERKE